MRKCFKIPFGILSITVRIKKSDAQYFKEKMFLLFINFSWMILKCSITDELNRVAKYDVNEIDIFIHAINNCAFSSVTFCFCNIQLKCF